MLILQKVIKEQEYFPSLGKPLVIADLIRDLCWEGPIECSQINITPDKIINCAIIDLTAIKPNQVHCAYPSWIFYLLDHLGSVLNITS